MSHVRGKPHPRVSGPSDSGNRSTSGDRVEGELRTGSIEVRVHRECHTIKYNG